MEQDQDVLNSLMTGLPERDRTGLRAAIRGAQADQLDRKKHPQRRRRRNVDGVLVELPPDLEDEYDEFEDAGDEDAGDEDAGDEDVEYEDAEPSR